MKKQIFQKLVTAMLTILCCTALSCGIGVITSTATNDNYMDTGLTIPSIIGDNNTNYRPLSDDDYFDGNTE